MITTAEIARLLRIVPDDIRSLYEVRMCNSNSLVKAQLARETAIAERGKVNKNMCRLIWILILALVVLLVTCTVLKPRYPEGILLGVTVVVMATLVVRGHLTDKKWNALNNNIIFYDLMFEGYQHAVDNLNPLGTGNSHHDLYDRTLIQQKAVSTAYRVLDAQEKFDACRKKEEVSRFDVIRAGEWVEKCEKDFDRIWDSITLQFGLEFDKVRIFALAKEQLAKSRPE